MKISDAYGVYGEATGYYRPKASNPLFIFLSHLLCQECIAGGISRASAFVLAERPWTRDLSVVLARVVALRCTTIYVKDFYMLNFSAIILVQKYLLVAHLIMRLIVLTII